MTLFCAAEKHLFGAKVRGFELSANAYLWSAARCDIWGAADCAKRLNSRGRWTGIVLCMPLHVVHDKHFKKIKEKETPTGRRTKRTTQTALLLRPCFIVFFVLYIYIYIFTPAFSTILISYQLSQLSVILSRSLHPLSRWAWYIVLNPWPISHFYNATTAKYCSSHSCRRVHASLFRY